MLRMLVAVLALTMLAACDNPLTPGADELEPLLRTSGPEYRLERSGDMLTTAIDYVFYNYTGGPVYLPNCKGNFELRLERLYGDDWSFAWAPIQTLCLSDPIVIEPGAVYRDNLQWPPAFREATISRSSSIPIPTGSIASSGWGR